MKKSILKKIVVAAMAMSMIIGGSAVSFAGENDVVKTDGSLSVSQVKANGSEITAQDRQYPRKRKKINIVNEDTESVVKVEFIKEYDSPKPFEVSNDIKCLGSVLYCDQISIDGEKRTLYPTFASAEDAMKTISNECESVLKEMCDKYGLDTFGKSSWKDYYNVLPMYEEYVETQFDGVEKERMIYEKIPMLFKFFDIYENDEENNNIIQMVKTASEKFQKENLSEKNQMKNLSDKKNTYLISSEALKSVNVRLPQESRGVAPLAFTKSSAIAYAEKWATKYNPTYNKYENGDCTNFASQIKKAGGERQ